MKVSWDHCSQYMESHKIHVPKHLTNHMVLIGGAPPFYETPKLSTPIRFLWIIQLVDVPFVHTDGT